MLVSYGDHQQKYRRPEDERGDILIRLPRISLNKSVAHPYVATHHQLTYCNYRRQGKKQKTLGTPRPYHLPTDIYITPKSIKFKLKKFVVLVVNCYFWVLLVL